VLIQKDTGHETIIQKNLIANTVLQDCEGFWSFCSVEMSGFVVQTLETNLFISSLNLWENLSEGCQNLLLDSNDKKIARLNAFRCILSRIDYPEKIDAKELAVDPNLVRNGAREIVLMEDSQKSEAWRKLESPSRKSKKDKKKG